MKNKNYVSFKNRLQNKAFSKKYYQLFYKMFEKKEKIIAAIAIIFGVAILPVCLRNADFSSNPLLEEAERLEAEGADTSSAVKVLSISPANDATQISQNPAIILTFNQAMDPTSVKGITTGTACTQSVQLSKDDFTTCIPFEGAPTTNDNKKFVFSAALDLATTYKIKVTIAAKSASGVALQQERLMPNGFKTSATPTVPTVSNVEPAPNGTNISRSSEIKVQFSEKMDSSTITGNGTSTTCQGSVHLSKDNFTTCVPISAAGVTTDQLEYKFTPASGLDYSATYKIKVTTAAKSKAGIAMAADYLMPNGFTTVYPSITSIAPADGATGVALNPTFTVTFAQEMDFSTFSIVSGTGHAACAATNIQVRVKSNPTSCAPGAIANGSPVDKVFQITVNLMPLTEYQLVLRNQIKTKTSTGNAPIQEKVINFTTLNVPAPKVVKVDSTSTDGFYRAGLTGRNKINIRIKFDKEVNVTGAPKLELATNGGVAGLANTQASYKSGSGSDTLIFEYSPKIGDRSDRLNYASVNALTLNGGSVKDKNASTIAANLELPALTDNNALGKTAKLKVYFGLPDTNQNFCTYKDSGKWKKDTSNCMSTGTSGTYQVGSATHPQGQDVHYQNTPMAFSQKKSTPPAPDTVIEENTGILFSQKFSGAAMNHSTALAACTGSKRLPTIYELLSILDYSSDTTAAGVTFVNTSLFDSSILGKKIWSSSLNASTPKKGYFLNTQKTNLYSGAGNIATQATSDKAYALCVHNGSGYYPDQNLTAKTTGVINHKTVLDNNTALEWTKCSMKNDDGDILPVNSGKCKTPDTDNQMEWPDALKTCEKLTYAGKSDWRLPNVRELYSIVLVGKSPPLDTLSFEKINSISGNARYWTSTNYRDMATTTSPGPNYNRSYAIGSKAGIVITPKKDQNHYVRCVRSAENN